MSRKRLIALIVLVAFVGAVGLNMISRGGAATRSAIPISGSSANVAAATTAPSQPQADFAYAQPQSSGSTAGGMAPSDEQKNAPAQQIGQERLIIKTANVEAKTEYENLVTINQTMTMLTTRLGGYIVSTNDASTSDKNSALVAITFRVPVAKFDEALNSLASDTLEITRREISGDDVTAEFVDNESQLRNLEATSARLRELLAKAETVTEAVEVNRTLSEYESQIEVLKGRQKYLKDSAAMSLITLTVRTKYVAPEPVADTGWSPLRTAKEAWISVIEVGQDLVDLAIVLLVWSPLWLPLLLIGWFAWRKIRAIKPKTVVVPSNEA